MSLDWLDDLEKEGGKESPSAPKPAPRKKPKETKTTEKQQKKEGEQEFAETLKGDKKLAKDQIIEYITQIIQKNKKKYTLDYLRALKYNLDAINITK